MNDIEMLEDHIITLEKKIKELNDIIAGYQSDKKSTGVTKKKEDKFKLTWVPSGEQIIQRNPFVSGDQLDTLTTPGSMMYYSNDPVVLGQEHGVAAAMMRPVRG